MAEPLIRGAEGGLDPEDMIATLFTLACVPHDTANALASGLCASSPPTLPVMPVIAYMVFLQINRLS
jgi:hypothetical protein